MNKMSDSRRSVRAKKAVSYSAFQAEEDSDDDFAQSNPPPSKRTKLEKKEKSSKVDKIKATGNPVIQECKEKKTGTLTGCPNGSGRGGRKERVSLDDTTFSHEMELAMVLSVQDDTNKQIAGRKDIEAQIHVTGLTTEAPSTDVFPSDDKENMVVKPAPSFSEPSDEIILVETLDEDAGGRRKRKAAKAAVARQREMASEDSDAGEDQEELQADSCTDSSSDDYDAGDVDSDYEEFASSKKKTNPTVKGKGKSPKSTDGGKKPKAGGRMKKSQGDRKLKPTPTAAKTSDVTSKPSTPVTPLTRRPQMTGPVRGFTPPSVTGVKNSQLTNQSPPVARRSGWSPPSSSSTNDANPLGGVKLASPGQPLRLGLSRNVRIKPLHPNAKAI